MKISDLDLNSQSINFLHSEGYDELFAPQEQSVKAGLFNDKKNFLITYLLQAEKHSLQC